MKWEYAQGQVIDEEGNAVAIPLAWRKRYGPPGEGGIDPTGKDNNGRLIAAAPDLLAACEMALTASYRPMVEGELYILEKALAKARGEEEGL